MVGAGSGWRKEWLKEGDVGFLIGQGLKRDIGHENNFRLSFSM